MARKKKTTPKRPIESYEHKDMQRLNNLPAALERPKPPRMRGRRLTA